MPDENNFIKVSFDDLEYLPCELGLYLYVKGRSGSTGYCFEGAERIAKRMGTTVRNVQRWKKSLEKKRLLKIERGYNGKTSWLYPLSPNCDSDKSDSDKSDSDKSDTVKSGTLYSDKSDTLYSDKSDTHGIDKIIDKIIDKRECVNAYAYSDSEADFPSDTQSNNSDIQKKSDDGTELNELFASWYSAYPRKKDRKRALSAFTKIMKLKGGKEKDAFGKLAGASPAEKVDMLKRVAVEQGAGKETKYIPYPSTWLNGYRWQDGEYDAVSNQSQQEEDIYSRIYGNEFDNMICEEE